MHGYRPTNSGAAAGHEFGTVHHRSFRSGTLFSVQQEHRPPPMCKSHVASRARCVLCTLPLLPVLSTVASPSARQRAGRFRQGERVSPRTISRNLLAAVSPREPQLAQRTAYARQLRVDDLLPDLRDDVADVTHGDVTHVRFASGRTRVFQPWERMQVVRDGRRAARAWVLEMLAANEFSDETARTLPWFLAEALEQFVGTKFSARSSRPTCRTGTTACGSR